MRRALFLLAALLLCARPAQAQIAYVNGNIAFDASGSNVGSTAAAALAVTAGNHLVVALTWLPFGSNAAPTLADTAGNTFTHIASCLFLSPSNTRVAMFYAESVAGNAADVITATFPDAMVQYPIIGVVQHSGVASSGSFDVCSSGADMTPSCASPSLTTTSANEVIVTLAQQAQVFQTWSGTGLRVSDSPYSSGALFSEIVSSAGAYTITATSTDTTPVECTVFTATFRQAGAVSSTGTRSLLLGVP